MMTVMDMNSNTLILDEIVLKDHAYRLEQFGEDFYLSENGELSLLNHDLFNPDKIFKKTRIVSNLILGRIGQIGQFAQNSAMEVPNFEQDNVQTEINVMVKTEICGTAIYILVRVRALW